LGKWRATVQAATGWASQQAACHEIVIESHCWPRNSIEIESRRHKLTLEV